MYGYECYGGEQFGCGIRSDPHRRNRGRGLPCYTRPVKGLDPCRHNNCICQAAWLTGGIRYCCSCCNPRSLSKDGDYSEATLHPAAGNIPTITDPRFVLHEQKIDTTAWVDFATLKGHTIGVYEGTPLEMIGGFRDMAVGSETLYFVGLEYGHVRAHDFHGG